MRNKQSKQMGFTIVELLIVIVVIAILAAITVVAYNGIQDRANDSTVKQELTQLAKKIELARVDLGAYPESGQRSGSGATTFPGITYPLTKGAYSTSVNNIFYCDGTKSSQWTFAIGARSSSGQTFTYKPESGIQTSGSIPSTACVSGFDSGVQYSYGYNSTLDEWYSWTNG